MRKVLAIASMFLASMFMSHTAVAQEKSRMDEVLARGKVIVGVSSESPPFGFVDEKGELVGFDIDLAKLIAKGLFGSDDPKHIEFVKQSSAARWENVNSGKVDFGIHVATLLPDRIARVAFTRGYIDSSIVVIVKTDSKFKTFADLNSDKVTTAVLSTPVQAERAKQFFPKAKTTTLDSIGAQFTAVKGGRVDAAQLDEPVALWYASQNKDVRILGDRMTAITNAAIYMKQGDFKWWLALDTYVAEMRAGGMFNDYAASYKKWFGKAPLNAKYYANQK